MAPSIFLLGLLFGSGPCLVSCGPLLVSYVAGTEKSMRQGAAAYFLFSSAKILAYLLLSLAVFFAGRLVIDRLLGDFSKYIFVSAGVFIVILGVFIAVGSRPEFRPWQLFYARFINNDRKSLLILGLVTGLLPCAPLLAVFSYLGLVSGSWPRALYYGLLFGAGTMISPLLALTICAGLVRRFLSDRNNFYCVIFNFICGSIIVFLGLRLFWRIF